MEDAPRYLEQQPASGSAQVTACSANASPAREEHKKFLDMWSQADADIKVLQEVKVEVAKLGT